VSVEEATMTQYWIAPAQRLCVALLLLSFFARCGASDTGGRDSTVTLPGATVAAPGVGAPGATGLQAGPGGVGASAAGNLPPGAAGAAAMGPGLAMSPTFDMQSSLQAFTHTVYPILRDRCKQCHSDPPEGKGQLPMHANADPAVAHTFALTRVNLRQVPMSRLVQRQGIEGHNCWGDCAQNSKEIQTQVQAWADAVKSSLPVSTLPVPDGDVTEAQVLQWINDDKAKVAPADQPYIKYASLHRLQNRHATADDMNTARAGISKILNSTARYAPAIVNPVAIDPFSLVYRFDMRKYWGYRGGLGAASPDPTRATEIWNRVIQGNNHADDLMSNNDTPADSHAKDTPTFPNIAGFFPDYVDGTQLGYTLSRPDVYNEIMTLPGISAQLENELGVASQGVDSWKFMTIDNAITLNHRMLLRAKTTAGFFWKGVDPFAMSPFIFYDRPVPEMDGGFSLVLTTPVFDDNGNYSMSYGMKTDASGHLVGGPQAQASEMIFSLPNGLQGYMIGGAANQIRVDAFPFIVVDPRRGGIAQRPTGFRLGPESEQRLIIPASCMGCHVDGMNRANDDMIPYTQANPTKFDTATMARVNQLYPGRDAMRSQIEDDRVNYGKSMQAIREAMIVGIDDKSLYFEPIMFLFQSAQDIFSYKPTASN
jgi:hypothetical protein